MGPSRCRLARHPSRSAAKVLRPKELTSYAAGSWAVVTAYDIASCRRSLAPSAMSVDRIATPLVGVGERAGSLPGSTPENLDPGWLGMPGGRLTPACPRRGLRAAQKCAPAWLALFKDSTDCQSTVNDSSRCGVQGHAVPAAAARPSSLARKEPRVRGVLEFGLRLIHVLAGPKRRGVWRTGHEILY
jgi:hypothetical protein